jgi:hypothetical protein
MNLKTLLDDPALRQGLGERGRKFVREHHNNEAIGRTLMALYQDLLTAQRTEPPTQLISLSRSVATSVDAETL